MTQAHHADKTFTTPAPGPLTCGGPGAPGAGDPISHDLRGGKWRDPSVPRWGWYLVDEDENPDLQTCEMCESASIRYVHVLAHRDYERRLEVGCVCAGVMTGDEQGSKLREGRLRNRSSRIQTTLDRCSSWCRTPPVRKHSTDTTGEWIRDEALRAREPQILVAGGGVWAGLLAPVYRHGCRLALLLVDADQLQVTIDQYQQLANEKHRVPGCVVHMPKNRTWKCGPKPRPAQFGGGDEPMLHVRSWESARTRHEWVANLQPDLIVGVHDDHTIVIPSPSL